MNPLRPSRTAAVIIPQVVAAFAAVALFPLFLTRITARETPLEADITFSSHVPAVRVTWDDESVLKNSAKIVSIPGHTAPTREWIVTISASGERNPSSHSSYVWVFGMETPEQTLEEKNVVTGGLQAWSVDTDERALGGKVYKASYDGPKTFEAKIGGSHLKLSLLTNFLSGKVTITVNGVSEQVDLYAAHPETVITRLYESVPIESQETRKAKLSFKVPSGQTYIDELRFTSSGGGTINIESVATKAGLLEQLGPNRFSSPTTGRGAHLYAAICCIAIFLALTSFLRFATSLGHHLLPQPKLINTASQWMTLPVAILLTSMISAYNMWLYGAKFAWVNAIPAFLSTCIIATATARLSLRWRLFTLFVWLFLALRTPLLGGGLWSVCHMAGLASLVLVAFYLLFESVEENFEKRLLSTAWVVITVVSVTHLGLLSAYTYSAIRPGWPVQFTVPIDGVLVNADLPHFLDLFQAYTNPLHRAGYSTTLRRFFYEYVWSTAWPTRPVWALSAMLNMFFWFGAVVSLLHLSRYLTSSRRARTVVTLGAATSVAMAAVVGQPIFYLAAYAWAPILVWAAMRLISSSTWQETLLPSSLLGAAVATYDVVPVSAACVITLLLRKRFGLALGWIAIHASVTMLWSHKIQGQVLQTFGNPSNAAFLAQSISTWKTAILEWDSSAMITYLKRGSLNALFAGFGVGLLVIPFLLFAKPRRLSREASTLVVLLILLTCLYTAAGCVVAPQMRVWSYGSLGLIPRYSYYYFPASLCAYGVIADRTPRWVSYLLLLMLAAFVLSDIFGNHRLGMILHFGDYYGTFPKWI